ncbi:MAG: hypothetical protein EA402_08295 [Planctomycetota bacterium]|nr:MAG: hypothetical protein EA402_08295 [Planctomycetota bacterium]
MMSITGSLAASYGPDPRQAFDLLLPVPAQGPLLILLHGGWWRRGHRQDLLSTAAELAQAGHAVACLGYRLLQGSRTGADLVADVVSGVIACVEEALVSGFGAGEVPEVVLVGSGAGGLLAACAAPVLITRGQESGRRAAAKVATSAATRLRLRGLAMIGTAPGLEPWQDCPREVVEVLNRFRGESAVAMPFTAEQALPPAVLLVHGDNDDEVPAQLAQGLHARLVQRDVASTLAIIAGAGHRFVEDPHSQAGRSALNRLGDWLRRLGQPSQGPGEEQPVIGEPAWLNRER